MISGWAFRAFSTAGPAGSRRACATPADDPLAVGRHTGRTTYRTKVPGPSRTGDLCVAYVAYVAASVRQGPEAGSGGDGEPGGRSVPVAARRRPQSAQPWLSTCWAVDLPSSMSSRISSAVSAYPVSGSSSDFANTTPYTFPSGVSSGPPELPWRTVA